MTEPRVPQAAALEGALAALRAESAEARGAAAKREVDAGRRACAELERRAADADGELEKCARRSAAPGARALRALADPRGRGGPQVRAGV